MKLEKKGCIYCPDGHNGWDVDTFMTPHAMLVNNEAVSYTHLTLPTNRLV